MSDLVEGLREEAKWGNTYSAEILKLIEALERENNDMVIHFDGLVARIKRLEEELGVLFAANVRLNSRADLDSDGYVDRIEKLEAALREIIEVDPLRPAFNCQSIARKALIP